MARGDDDVGLPPDEPPTDEDGRHIIRLPGRRVQVVDATIAALASQEIFQRGGGLVDIVRDPENGEGDVVVPSGEPRVRVTPFTRAYELCTLACKFEARRKDPERSEKLGKVKFSVVEVDPPSVIVKTLMERGEWAHVRPLDALVDWPVLRPNGTIFSGPGYDIGTRCYSTSELGIDIPPCVTPAMVEEAVAKLHDIVCDFPFERPEHRSAWLSALLTILARPAIAGPVPMVIFDANDRGSGKTLLCDLIGAILTGAGLPRRGVPESGKEDEWGKIMLGIGIGSYPVVLFDNVTSTLRSATLDMVLTGEVFQGRVLGLNKEMRVPVRTQFLVSSNNAMISNDLVRRSLHCRIVVDEERPEKRTGFKYNLPNDAMKMRAELLRAAFIVLVGYEQAGRPQVQKRAIGSYDAWAARIQSPMVWAGLPDPVQTQDELREQADTEGEQLGPLLEAWHEYFGERQITIKDAMAQATEESSSRFDSANPKAVAFLEAVGSLAEHGKKISNGLLGYRVRKWKDKWMNSMAFSGTEPSGGKVKWFVRRKA